MYSKILKVVLLIIGCLLFVQSRKEYIQNSEITKARNLYKEKLTMLSDYRDEEGIVSSVTVDLYFDDLVQVPTIVKDWFKVKVNVSDEVEKMSERQKCILLHSYLVDLEHIIDTAKEESGYKETIEDASLSITDDLKYRGKYVHFSNSYDIDFISPEYKYAFEPRYFYKIKPNLWGTDSFEYEFQEDELTVFKNTKENRSEYATDIPYVGMNEGMIGHTKWGRADIVEESVDFDLVNYHHKSKTYKWYDIDDKTWLAVVTVLYDESGHGTVQSVSTYTK